MPEDSERAVQGETSSPPSAPDIDGSPLGEPSQAVDPWYDDHRSLRFRLTERLSRLSGGRVKSPGYFSALDFSRKQDAADLIKYRIGDDEGVQSWCMWTLEFFTPDNISALSKALERLKPAGFEYEERGLADWLKKNRGRSGNSIELYLVPKGKPGLGIGHFCTLPAFAKAACGTIANITPSLTTLTMHFLLDEHERTWLDAELRRDHPSRAIQRPGGVVSISNVWLEQRALVEQKRRSWAKQAADWHKENFPGLLSANDGKIAVCLLDVVSGTDLMPSRPSNLLNALEITRSLERYEATGKDGELHCVLTRPSNKDEDGSLHLISIGLDQLEAQETGGFGTTGSGRIAHFDAMFRRTYTWVALHRVLDFYQGRVVLARDSAAAIVGSRNATKALARVRADTAQSIDAAVIARELAHAAKTGWIPFSYMDFTYRPAFPSETPRPMGQMIRERILRQSTELLADVEALNDSLTVQANLLSAHVNLKLQPWIIGLAAVSMVAGVIAAIGPVRELLQPKPVVATPKNPTQSNKAIAPHLSKQLSAPGIKP